MSQMNRLLILFLFTFLSPGLQIPLKLGQLCKRKIFLYSLKWTSLVFNLVFQVNRTHVFLSTACEKLSPAHKNYEPLFYGQEVLFNT